MRPKNNSTSWDSGIIAVGKKGTVFGGCGAARGILFHEKNNPERDLLVNQSSEEPSIMSLIFPTNYDKDSDSN
jgi:hypothetical protein